MKEVSLQSPTRREGVIMFALLICAYIIFATNWVAGSNLSKQITDHYFNGEKGIPYNIGDSELYYDYSSYYR